MTHCDVGEAKYNIQINNKKQPLFANKFNKGTYTILQKHYSQQW